MILLAGAARAETPMPLDKAARVFGALPSVEHISLSPDGTRVAIVAPSKGAGTVIQIAPMGGTARTVMTSEGSVARIGACGWSASDRLVCGQYGNLDYEGQLIGFTRMFAMDADGANAKDMTRRSVARDQTRVSQFSGGVLDWMGGQDGTVLMIRDFVPESTTGTRLASTDDGFGVERVDTRTLKATPVEKANPNARGYISDGRGNVRVMRVAEIRNELYTGKTVYFYRNVDHSGTWRKLAEADNDSDASVYPIAVDPELNAAYALKRLDRRMALYRIGLDDEHKTDLVGASPEVDIEDVIQIGRSGRVIGMAYTTDRRQMVMFDPAYKSLIGSLGKAIPGLPLVQFIGASADEKILLLRASSDVDPGRYYALDRTTHRLNELLLERPELENEHLAPVRSITYRTPDGAAVPAYLTLPLGGGKKLPGIVLPHGGPAARDEWGFDWLAQFYAARGYAVIQPNFRGSTGYGDAWFVDNGFKSWKTAVGDIAAAGRWMVSEGIVDPAHLAAVGWSYGGYAALQSSVTAQGLFKAVVAIAPVTDLDMLKNEAVGFRNSRLVSAYIGDGDHIRAGSPLQHASEFKVPVLMFHGDRDINVKIGESRALDLAIRKAGGQSELVVFKGLDHQLLDGQMRADMLMRSDKFLRSAMGLGPAD